MANTLAWYMLSRHLLYLYIFIQFVSGVVMIVMANNCKKSFDNFEIMPINMAFPQGALSVAVDMIFLFISSKGFLSSFQSLVGLAGAIYFNKYPLINFTYGILTFYLFISEMVLGIELSHLLKSFEKIIRDGMVDLFGSTTRLNTTIFPEREEHVNLTAVFEQKYHNGWSLASGGSVKNRTNVDYMQINHKCCGLKGREYWAMKIPLSCCPEKYRGIKCIFSVAYSKGCMYEYDKFHILASQLLGELITFSLISLLTACTCLYLAYLKYKYPDGNYRSDSSSSSDNEDEY